MEEWYLGLRGVVVCVGVGRSEVSGRREEWQWENLISY